MKVPKFIHSFTLIEKVKRNKYKYRCKCGKTKIFDIYFIKNNKVKCTCVQFRDNILSKDQMKLFKRYIDSAQKRRIVFNLKQSEFKKLINQSCHFCGEIPKQELNDLRYNGIDRLDSKKGYITTNVYSCCFRCNRAKSNMTFPEFDIWLEKLVDYQNEKNKLLLDMSEESLNKLDKLSGRLK